MEVLKKEDHYLLSNQHGSYHLSFEEFERIGKEDAIKLAKEEIKKKSKAQYFNETINFDQARELGFCEFGIKDFCEKLSLDIDSSYSIKELSELLTLEVLVEYPNECLKLFGKKVIDKFGGVEKVLKEKGSESSVFYFIVDNFIEDDILHKFSVKAAYYSLKNFEKEFPEDKRPRLAIEAKEKFIKGEIIKEELSAAWSAARSAESAAWSAARSARSAARSAESASAWSAAESARSAARSTWSAARSTWSAAWSAESAESAAWSAARSAARSTAWSAESAESAAWSAAYSAAYSYFSEELIKLLNE